jgi:hypothetical protein
MSGPTNFKIQKTGAEEIGNAKVRLPASDLERWKDADAIPIQKRCQGAPGMSRSYGGRSFCDSVAIRQPSRWRGEVLAEADH